LFFSLFNSSDVFLLLQAKESGLNDSEVIGMYIFYNLIYALFAYPIGILADKLGLKNIFIFGLLLFSIVYFGMAFSSHWTVSAILFLIYGIYAASTEGVSKAWISNIAEKSDTATAIGTYTALQSIAALISSSMAGLIWYFWGAAFTFIITASAAIISAFYLFFTSNYIKKTKSV
jgi:MFS family permease